MPEILQRIRNFKRCENAQVTAIFAIVLLALTGLVAVVGDAGFLYATRASMQSAVDAAVLAGVQELPSHPQDALNLAVNYSNRNGLQQGEYTYTLEYNTKIHGEAHRTVNLFFARAIGFSSTVVDVEAEAQIAPLSQASGLVPWGVWEHDYEFGDMVILKQGAGEWLYPGWFGALRFEGDSGANDYRNNIKYGYPGTISIGDIIDYEPGNMSGPTKQAVQYRMDLCTHSPKCTIDNYVPGCGRIVFVPIINNVDVGHHQVRVVGFAAFIITNYVGSGQDNSVQGAFIEYVIPGMTSPDAGDFGLHTTQLTK